jgi:predicted O-methyltransferase YrrM
MVPAAYYASPVKATTTARQRAAQRLFGAAVRVSGGRMLPVGVVNTISRIADRDPFSPQPPIVDGSSMANPALARLLGGIVLGYWTLGPATLELVRRTFEAKRPHTIVEFGSGASTIVLAALAREIPGCKVISIDQAPEHATRTASLLGERGLQDQVKLLVFPMADMVIEGLRTQCYSIDASLGEHLDGRAIDLVLVDGPAGPPGVRFGTLPLIAGYLADGAVVILDDAFRQGELEVARRWRRLPYVRVNGIAPVDKGVLLARIDLAGGGRMGGR